MSLDLGLVRTYPNNNISSDIDFGPINGPLMVSYYLAGRLTEGHLISLISAFQCKEILIWEFPRCLTSPSLKISPETHFSHFSQSWNVSESVNWAFPSCSAPTFQPLHYSWCFSKKRLSSFHHSWATVLLLIGELCPLTPRSWFSFHKPPQGMHKVQLNTNVICKKHKSNRISGTLLSRTLWGSTTESPATMPTSSRCQQYVIVSSQTACKSLWQSWNLLR